MCVCVWFSYMEHLTGCWCRRLHLHNEFKISYTFLHRTNSAYTVYGLWRITFSSLSYLASNIRELFPSMHCIWQLQYSIVEWLHCGTLKQYVVYWNWEKLYWILVASIVSNVRFTNNGSLECCLSYPVFGDNSRYVFRGTCCFYDGISKCKCDIELFKQLFLTKMYWEVLLNL